jgi:hypothetical protein
MKKAKIMLASVAVLAVVGGALAFKAKTFTADFYCTPGHIWAGQTNIASTATYNPTLVGTELFCNPNTFKSLTTGEVEETTVVVE